LTLTNLGLAQTVFKQRAKIASKQNARSEARVETFQQGLRNEKDESPKTAQAAPFVEAPCVRATDNHHEKEFSKEEKLKILHTLKGKSSRDAQRELMKHISLKERVSKESVRAVTEDSAEMRLTIDNKTIEKLKELKALLAHKMPRATTAELIDFLCDLGLEKFDPLKKICHARARAAKAADAAMVADAPKIDEKKKDCLKTAAPRVIEKAQAKLYQTPQPIKSHQRCVPFEGEKRVRLAAHKRRASAQLRYQVWQNAKGRCENCASRWALEIDHITPFAKGGATELKNLRLLCRSCNQRRAIVEFGADKMKIHFSQINRR